MTRRPGCALLLLLAACSPAKPPPTPPAAPPRVETGKGTPAVPAPIEAGLDCVFARVACDLGSCAVEVHNECALPVRCEATTTADCRTDQGRTEEARATDRRSVGVDSATTLEANADCGARPIGSTRLSAFRCR